MIRCSSLISSAMTAPYGRGARRRVAACFGTLMTLLVAAGCSAGDDAVDFDEGSVRAEVEASGRFETVEEVEQAIATFRRICETPATSVNEFSVHDLVVNRDGYNAEFLATARLGCPDLFATVVDMIDAGSCFGGALEGCDPD